MASLDDAVNAAKAGQLAQRAREAQEAGDTARAERLQLAADLRAAQAQQNRQDS